MTSVTLTRVLVRTFLCAAACTGATAQEQPTPAIVTDAVQHELDAYKSHAWGLEYRVHRIDSKDDSLREVIETADGNVSRTLTWKGRALTSEELDGEKKRLEALTAGEVQRRRDKSQSSDKYAAELIRAMPKAMLYTPVLDQQQPMEHAQAVFDFVPNPAFQPTDSTQSLLTGLAGRIWIDREDHRLSRIDLRITKNLNLMFGILARVYEGGTVTYEQRPVAPGVYCYSRVAMNVKLRELMLRTVPYKQTLTVSDIHFLPTAPTVKQAVSTLLALPPVTP